MKEAKERERERRELRYSAALYEFHVELEFSWRHDTFSSTPGGFISGPYSLNLRDFRAWASGPKPPAGVRPPYYKIAFIYFTSTFLSQTRSHIDSQSPRGRNTGDKEQRKVTLERKYRHKALASQTCLPYCVFPFSYVFLRSWVLFQFCFGVPLLPTSATHPTFLASLYFCRCGFWGTSKRNPAALYS